MTARAVPVPAVLVAASPVVESRAAAVPAVVAPVVAVHPVPVAIAARVVAVAEAGAAPDPRITGSRLTSPGLFESPGAALPPRLSPPRA